MQTHTSYKNILIAIDLEHEPEKVISKALNFIQEENTIIHLIHVVMPISDALYASGLSLLPPVIDIDKLQQQSLDAARSKLKTLAELFPKLISEYSVILGQPAQEIIHAANSKNTDLIIVGSHGKHGIRLLLGSTATSVLHHAKCDTLAVRV